MTNATGNKLCRTVRISACGEDRIGHFDNLDAVAHGTIDHDPGDADLAACRHPDRSHQRRGLIAFAIDHKDIAWLRHRHPGMNHEVVARSNLDRKGRPADSHIRAQCPNPRMQCTTATGHVGEDGWLNFGRLLNDLRWNAFKVTPYVGKRISFSVHANLPN